MAPLDAAIYDIMAKSAGLPVYKFLGGYRDSVPVYVTGGYYREGKGIPELLTEVQGYVDQGINAIKLKVGALHERLVTSHSACKPHLTRNSAVESIHWRSRVRSESEPGARSPGPSVLG